MNRKYSNSVGWLSTLVTNKIEHKRGYSQPNSFRTRNFSAWLSDTLGLVSLRALCQSSGNSVPPSFPPLDIILRIAADILINSKMSLRVLHYPGKINKVADAISRSLFDEAELMVGRMTHEDFEQWNLSFSPGASHRLSLNRMALPPRLTLGEQQS